jgi:hypothetical protein
MVWGRFPAYLVEVHVVTVLATPEVSGAVFGRLSEVPRLDT